MKRIRYSGAAKFCVLLLTMSASKIATEPTSDAAAPAPAIQRKRGIWSELAFLTQVSRPGLWSTTALFYLMPLGHRAFWRSGAFWTGLVYVLFSLGLILYGVNDIVDAEADRFNPRKGTFLFGSRGAAEQLRALRWQIALAQLPFAVIFFLWIGPRILLWFAGLLLAVSLYNAPRLGWKSRPPFDVLIQASYLLVFVLSSWLNGVPQLPWQTFVFGAMFAMHSHVFGEVMDIGPDRASGRKTTATVIGAVPAKFLIAAFLSVETVLVYTSFRDTTVALFLAVGALWFVFDAGWFWKSRAYTAAQMRAFMWAWNAAAVAGMYWNWASASLTQEARL